MTGGVLVWRDLICSFDCLLVVFVILHCIYIATSGCREYSSNSVAKFFLYTTSESQDFERAASKQERSEYFFVSSKDCDSGTLQIM